MSNEARLNVTYFCIIPQNILENFFSKKKGMFFSNKQIYVTIKYMIRYFRA